MSDKTNTAVLDSLFEPVTQCFTPEVARRIAGLRATPEAQARLDALAEKCGEGTLTAEEQGVYEATVRAVNFIGVLQAKALASLNDAVKQRLFHLGQRRAELLLLWPVFLQLIR